MTAAAAAASVWGDEAYTSVLYGVIGTVKSNQINTKNQNLLLFWFIGMRNCVYVCECLRGAGRRQLGE